MFDFYLDKKNQFECGEMSGVLSSFKTVKQSGTCTYTTTITSYSNNSSDMEPNIATTWLCMCTKLGFILACSRKGT